MRIRRSKTDNSEARFELSSSLKRDAMASYLREVVAHLAIPRHYEREPENNLAVASWIESEFEGFGLSTSRQGPYSNIVAEHPGCAKGPRVLIGAHFDSVPKSPGADDNASAVAAMLAVAKHLAPRGPLPVTYVAFNREEDGLLGSIDFVQHCRQRDANPILAAHILEMVGFCSHLPGSQTSPAGLPFTLPDIGDFLAIVMNDTSNHFADELIALTEEHIGDLPVMTLEVFGGMENSSEHLLRSDHTPFWRKHIPALMWTDTADFRNPNYHLPSDTPDTLDYTFTSKVVKLLVLHTLQLVSRARSS